LSRASAHQFAIAQDRTPEKVTPLRTRFAQGAASAFKKKIQGEAQAASARCAARRLNFVS
jgi:hypothetical protein